MTKLIDKIELEIATHTDGMVSKEDAAKQIVNKCREVALRAVEVKLSSIDDVSLYMTLKAQEAISDAFIVQDAQGAKKSPEKIGANTTGEI